MPQTFVAFQRVLSLCLAMEAVSLQAPEGLGVAGWPGWLWLLAGPVPPSCWVPSQQGQGPFCSQGAPLPTPLPQETPKETSQIPRKTFSLHKHFIPIIEFQLHWSPAVSGNKKHDFPLSPTRNCECPPTSPLPITCDFCWLQAQQADLSSSSGVSFLNFVTQQLENHLSKEHTLTYALPQHTCTHACTHTCDTHSPPHSPPGEICSARLLAFGVWTYIIYLSSL